MRAVVIREPGEAEVLEVRDIPEPVYGPEEVLVAVRATALNRADLLQRRGLYPHPAPQPEFDVPGLEYTGEVVEVGSRVCSVRVGDRVMGILTGGGYAIIDYKTGLPPSAAEVKFGFAPQLPLEAIILAAGGFKSVNKGDTSELAYWRLSGGEPAGEIRIVEGDPGELAEAAHDGLMRLVNAFDDPATPYMATPRPQWATAWNDYVHLARNAEWAAGGGGNE